MNKYRDPYADTIPTPQSWPLDDEPYEFEPAAKSAPCGVFIAAAVVVFVAWIVLITFIIYGGRS